MGIAQSHARHGAGLMFANVLAQLGVPVPAEPGAVQLIVPLAGARHVKLASFLFYDLMGILLWAALPATGGMLFHHQAETLLSVLSNGAPRLAGGALVVASGVLVWRRRSGRGRSQWAPR